MPRKTSSARDFPQRRLLWLLPVLLAGVAHLGVLGNRFAYDDVRVIDALRQHRIALIGAPAPRPGQPTAPPMLRDQEARRLTYAFHLLDHRLWGENPRGYHLTNLVLHMVVTGLAYAAARAWTFTPAGALAAALVFAVHPLHVEAIASFANRKDLLALIFALAALLAWVRVRRAGIRWLLTGACVLLGLAAKEIAVVGLPVMLLAADGILGRGREEGRPSPWQIVTFRLLAFALVVVVAAGLLFGGRLPLFDGAHNREATEQQLDGYGDVLANAALGIGRMVRMLVVPVGLSADYPLVTVAPWGNVEVWFGILSLLALIVVPLALYRRHARVALAIAWVLVLYLPISNLVPLVHFFAADRYAYVPSFGACVLFGLAMERWQRRASKSTTTRLAPAAAVVLGVGLFTVASARRVADWRSDLTLWSSASRAGYETYRIHQKLGVALLLAGDENAEAAAGELSKAVALRPGLAESHRWLAGAFLTANRLDDAWREANATLGIDSTDAVCRFIRGEFLLQRGDSTRALTDYRATIASDSSHFGATMRIVTLDLAHPERPGSLEEALALARRAERIAEPDFRPEAARLAAEVEAAMRRRAR